MTVSLDEMMAELPPERRRRIEERAAELIADEMTLCELRKALQLTQASVARELGISQDAHLPTGAAQRPVALHTAQDGRGDGRHLTLIARFPDRPPVELSGIADPAARD